MTHDAERWDAIVIGAGPAGSVAALELARRGIRTLLVEKATFPRPKVCGGCLNGNAIAALSSIGLGDLPHALGATRLDRLHLAAQGKTASISLAPGLAVSRVAFDSALVREAIRAGATFRDGVTAEIGEEHDESREVMLRSARETTAATAKVVIAATGLNGKTGSTGAAMAHAARNSRIGAGVVLNDAPEEYRTGIIHMATSAGGYVGLVCVEDRKLEIAAAFDPAFVRASHGVGSAAARVIADAGFPAISGLQDAPWKGTQPLTRSPARIAGHRWFAVGDAAGYVEPFTGEGMAWAMSGAVAVAAIAVRGATQWNDELIREWTRTHSRTVGRRQWLCRVLSHMLRSPRVCRLLVRALSVAPAVAGPFVHLLNRPTRMTRGFL